MKYTVSPCDLDYNTNKHIIEDLIKKYPFLNIQLIGRTAVGRGIFALSLGNNKKSGIYIGSVRGSDGFSALILLLFIERLCYAVKNNYTLACVDIRKALSLSGVTVIPCLNPDGREISLYGVNGAGSMGSYISSLLNKEQSEWNSNAMGVDINRNFIFRNQTIENTHSPAPSDFRGDYPESEAETKALTRLCRLKHFDKCLVLYRGEREIFYRSDEGEPVSSSMAAKILACSSSIPVNSSKNILHSGITDWFIKEFQKPAFNMGVGENIHKLYTTYAKLEEALVTFSLL